MKQFREYLQQGASPQELYVTKLRGNICYVPNKLHELFCHCLPQLWKRKTVIGTFYQQKIYISYKMMGNFLTADLFLHFENIQQAKIVQKAQRWTQQ